MPNRAGRPRYPLALGLTCLAIFVVALAWSFQLGRAKGVTEGENTANADTYAHQADQEIQDRCLGLAPVDMASCIRQVVEATNEHERAERDLVAQLDSARWGLSILIISVVGTALGAVGTVLIYRTLAATRETVHEARRTTRAAEDSVREARNATKAARESVDVTRQIGKAQVRAYVSVIEYKGEMHRPRIEVGDRCHIPFTIKNTGSSPARRLRYSARLLIAPPSFATDDIPLVRPDTQRPPETTLGSGDPIFGFAALEVPLSEWDFHELTKPEPERRLFLYGVVDYADVFARDSFEMHFTQFCSEVRITRVQGEDGAKLLKLNYIKTARHNHAT